MCEPEDLGWTGDDDRDFMRFLFKHDIQAAIGQAEACDRPGEIILLVDGREFSRVAWPHIRRKFSDGSNAA